MKVSLNVVNQYINFGLPPVDELVARINAQLGGVEEVINLETKYKDAKIVKVVECEKHANADKLSVCKIDVGTGELVQVVCGANNVHAGMWAVWLPPESTVPATYGTDEPFVLGARELRGVMSNGMLASARELGIGDDHDGIVDITERDVPYGKELNAGASFAKVFGLDDIIIDIENKMFTHRPDLFGQLGVAREIAGIYHKPFTSPEWYFNVPEFSKASGLDFEVFNDAPDKAPRFMAVVMKDITVGPSPFWLQCALVAMGSKPINNIVDVTNYIMLLTAQPTHAYDYDKLRGHKLGVRMAKAGEKVTLLNHKTYELSEDDIVIADGEGPVGLAGIMGGGESEVSFETKNIVLEVATFDMYAVRKSSMRHGLFTDALARFNKGQSPFQNDHVLNLLMMSIKDVSSDAEQTSEVFDLGNFNDDCVFDYSEDKSFSHQHKMWPHGITEKFINDRLGLELEKSEIATLLENVEFKVSIDDNGLDIYDPFWRTDIEAPEDIVEEVGRLYGFDKLPRELPLCSTKPTAANASRELAQQARSTLARSGANEVLTYSFVHERILKAAGQQTSDAYQLSNALSPDLQYYRLSLTPNLLDKIHANIKAGYDEFALFEIGKAHSKSAGLNEEDLPVEMEHIAFVYASKNLGEGAPFYRAKQFLEFLASQLGVHFAYEPLGAESTAPSSAPFEAKRSAIVTDQKTGLYVGLLGEYTKATQRNFKLPEYAAGFELNIEALLQLAQQAEVQYRPLSRFPSVDRDVSLQVGSDMPYAEVYTAFEAALAGLAIEVDITPLGLYQPEGANTKNITFRLVLTSHEKTLTSAEVNEIVDTAVVRLKSAIDAEVV